MILGLEHPWHPSAALGGHNWAGGQGRDRDTQDWGAWGAVTHPGGCHPPQRLSPTLGSLTFPGGCHPLWGLLPILVTVTHPWGLSPTLGAVTHFGGCHPSWGLSPTWGWGWHGFLLGLLLGLVPELLLRGSGGDICRERPSARTPPNPQILIPPPSIPAGNTHRGSRSNPEFLGIKQKQAEGGCGERAHPVGTGRGKRDPWNSLVGRENSLQPLQG